MNCAVARVILLAAVIATPLVAQTREPPLTARDAFDSAQTLYNAGKWTEALAAFRNFQQDNKFSVALPRAIYLEGWCCFNLKRYREAADAFERVVHNYPNADVVPEAMLKRAECLRAVNQPDQAANLYHEFQTRFPKHSLLSQALLGEAWARFELGDLASAQALVEHVRDDYRDDPGLNIDAWLLLNRVFTEKNARDDASEAYRQLSAQRFDPRAAAALYRAGEAMFDAKHYTDAIALFQLVESKAALLTNVQQQIAAAESNQSLLARTNLLRQLQMQTNASTDLRPLALLRLGNCYQSLGKRDEATAAYRNLLDQYPDDKLAEQAKFALIESLIDQRRFAEAGDALDRFVSSYPNSPRLERAAFLQAETAFALERYGDALDRYLKFRASAKDRQLLETAEFRIGACYSALQRFDKARDTFAHFVEVFPQSKLLPEALFRLARTDSELATESGDVTVVRQRLAEAATCLERIRAREQGADLIAEATLELGYVCGRLGEYDKAITTFTEFTKNWPEHRQVPEAIYQIARNHAASRHYDDAVAAYAEVVRRFPDSELAPAAAYELGTTYGAAKRPADMIAALRVYTEKYPTDSHVGDALYAIGQQLETDGNTGQALAVYRDLIARAVTNPRGPIRDAAIAAQLRTAALLEPKEAIADCESFLSKFASEPVAVLAAVTEIAALYRKAKLSAEGYAKLEQLAAQYQRNAAVRVAVGIGMIDLAIGEKDYQRAYAAARDLLADPNNGALPASGYLAIGNAMLKVERYAEARDAFAKLLKLYADDTRALPLANLGLGQAELGLRNFDQAEAVFRKLIQTDPDNLDATLGLGKVYEARGNIKEAIATYDAVWRQGRGDAVSEAAFRVGMLAFQQKDYRTALPMFARLLFATGPLADEAAFRAAQCHEALGNIEQARSAYQTYLRRYPNGTFALEARTLLAKLPVPPA